MVKPLELRIHHSDSRGVLEESYHDPTCTDTVYFVSQETLESDALLDPLPQPLLERLSLFTKKDACLNSNAHG